MREDFERRLGKSYETMTQEQQQEVQLAYNEAIDNSFLYHNSIDKISIDEHRYDPNIETAVRNGDLEGVLNAVEASPYGQRFQPLVDRIRGLGLHTRFEASDAVSHPKFQNIVNKEIEYARRQKGEWDGAYSHLLDVVVLHNFSPKTAMHELVHAATIMRVKLAEAARLIPWEQRTPQQHALINDLTELEALFAKAKRVSKNRKAYGFTDIHEFLAEANSSETFQNELKSMTYEGVRIWQELLKWIRNTLGRVDANFNNALEHALDLTVRFENPDVDGLLETAEPNHDVVGPIHSMRRTDQGMVQATGWWEKMLQSAASKGNVGQRTTKALLQAFSTWHIQEWFSKSPSLRPISDSIKAYFAADSVKTQMVQNTSAEFAAQHRSLELAIQKLPTSDARRAMEREISFLALEMSGLNIDLNMGYPLNTHRNPNLERSAAMRDYVNNLHRRYMALPQNIRTPMEMTFALNRKNFIQKTSTMVRNYLQLQERTLGPQVHRWISRLDIRDPSLDQGSTPQRAPNQLPYYADAYTKNLDERLQTILREMQQSNISGEFEGIAKFYSSAVKNPYQHLGRFGDNFVEFQIQGSAQALAQIQQVLAPFNKVIGQPAAGNRHVFMRFEDAGERDKAFAAVKALGGNVATDLRGGSLEDRSHLQTAKGVPDFARSMISKLDATFDTTGMSQSEQDLLNEMHQSIKRWALDSIPETSSRKALSSRNIGRTLGYEADFMRSYTTRATSMTSTLANAYAMPLFNKAFADMKKAIDPLAKQDPALHSEAQMVHDEIAKRFANGLHPVESPIIDYGKAFGYNFFLAMSPSFWMVNLAQPWHLTFPYLGGHFGFVKSARAMGNASAKSLIIIKNTIAKGIAEGQALGGTRGAILGAIDAEIQLGTLSPGEAAFVRALASAGHLDSTQGHELGRAAEGTDPRLVATNKFMSAGSHYTEVMNRITAGLAGYNLELARSGGNAVKATERGMKAVAHTQFSYTDANIGRAWGRHGLALKYTPLLASFQQYSFQTMELLLRMVRDATFPIPENATPDQRREILLERRAAQKGLAGVMGTTSVIAGTMGLPFANVAARLVDALVDAWGDDDDEAWKAAGGDIAGGGAQGGDWGTPGAIPGQEGDWSDEVKRPGPSDIRSAYRSWLAGWAGKDLAEIIARGAPRALGFDVSARAGLQDLLPGSRFFTDRREMQDRMKDGVFNMMGPAVSAGMNMVNGISHMYDGRVMDGLIEFLPLALAGPAKAIRMEQVGYINATGNQLPLEVTGWDEFVQTVGFTPAKKAEQSEVNYSFKTRDLILKQQKNRLANSLYIEFERQGELTPEHMQSLEEWNTRYPEYKIDVGAALAARAKARGVAEISGTDIAALPRFMSVLNQYGYANTQ